MILDNAPSPFVKLIENRHRISKVISRSANQDSRLIAHFLLEYSDVEACLIDNENNIKGFMQAVLDKWFQQNELTKLTWQRLGSLLLFLGLNNIVNDIESEPTFQGRTLNEFDREAGKMFFFFSMHLFCIVKLSWKCYLVCHHVKFTVLRPPQVGRAIAILVSNCSQTFFHSFK